MLKHNSIVNNQDEDIEETVLLKGSQRILRSDKLKCQLVRLELKKISTVCLKAYNQKSSPDNGRLNFERMESI